MMIMEEEEEEEWINSFESKPAVDNKWNQDLNCGWIDESGSRIDAGRGSGGAGGGMGREKEREKEKWNEDQIRLWLVDDWWRSWSGDGIIVHDQFNLGATNNQGNSAE